METIAFDLEHSLFCGCGRDMASRDCRDFMYHTRMMTLNEQLKLIGTGKAPKLPLCCVCLIFHGKQITCEDALEYQYIDTQMWLNAQ